MKNLKLVTVTNVLRLMVCECDFGGESVLAHLHFDGDVVRATRYYGNAGNYAWSQHEGWADPCVGMTEPQVREWANTFFDDFDEGRWPYVAIECIG